ncbi:substrate-binding domain-containing protein [Neobacillus sp. 179-C4.2 HS]|uniref:Substrate-binding domain-containing protein n=1 Tax=Neobacillus driksii TaxID=3035913 RepID=A0ABV4YXV0_9BACI|nr:substrate-binding domain-containing protein [Neobacillus sp. 179.-C4.2 HS]MDP5195712.1 substrate-binding domain-containing protein [Neobacillus sp. 179.-C4.2 HS]
MKNNVTMRDIAERLGVSSVTVSKALNDKEGVSDDLKQKIKTVAEEMGYRYNTLAKSMKEGVTYNIGVIIPERFTGAVQSFYLNMYQSISRALEQYGYYGILHILTNYDEKELNLPRIYVEQKVDGFIILGQVGKKYIEKMKSMDLPKVFLDFYDEHAEIDAVITDNFYGAYDITNYIVSQGHRDIAFVGNIYSTSSIQDRFLGYLKSLLEHKIRPEESMVINDRDEEGRYIEMKLPERLPTAFVCNNDQVAHNLIQQLKREGYNVPDDCSVVGFDNDVYATLTEPQLTTVEVNVEEMAGNAAEFIIEKVKNPIKTYGRVSVKGKIIYRDSVKEIKTR